jgi:hypothetical protein
MGCAWWLVAVGASAHERRPITQPPLVVWTSDLKDKYISLVATAITTLMCDRTSGVRLAPWWLQVCCLHVIWHRTESEVRSVKVNGCVCADYMLCTLQSWQRCSCDVFVAVGGVVHGVSVCRSWAVAASARNSLTPWPRCMQLIRQV